jgi:hypothetical protein
MAKKKEVPKFIRTPATVRKYQIGQERDLRQRKRVSTRYMRILHGEAEQDPESPIAEPVEHGMPLLYLENGALANVELTINSQVGRGPLVGNRWQVYAIHSGELLGVAPTRRELTISGVTLMAFDEDRLVEQWTYWDLPGLLEQIGAPA